MDQYPRFGEAFIRGREGADAAVAGALYMKATGFERKSEKVHVLKDGTVVRVPVVEYYPPDSTAIPFYLANRQPEWWRHRPENSINVNLDLRQLILDSIQLEQEEKQKLKTIEHEPAAPPAPEALATKVQE